jgi:hypothetical protein
MTGHVAGAHKAAEDSDARLDVFVSYKRKDRRRVEPLVDSLRRAGLSVWWDPDIPGGMSWRQALIRHLDAARCVIVVWTEESVGVGGEFVQEEASRANARHVLLPVRLDDVSEPLGFGHIQSVDLTDWYGDVTDERLENVVAQAKSIVAGRIPRPQPPNRPWKGITRLFLNALSVFPQYVDDLLRLLAGPKGFLRVRSPIPSGTWRDGLRFLAVSVLLTESASFPAMGDVSMSLHIAGVMFLFWYVLLYGLATLVSWRMVGAKAPVDRFFANHFYIAGVVKLIMTSVFLLIVSVARAVDSVGWDKMITAAKTGHALDFFLKNGSTMADRPEWLLVSAIGVLGYGCILMWVFMAWGAYREMNNLSRLRSAVAFVLFCSLIAPIVVVTTLVGDAMNGTPAPSERFSGSDSSSLTGRACDAGCPNAPGPPPPPTLSRNRFRARSRS